MWSSPVSVGGREAFTTRGARAVHALAFVSCVGWLLSGCGDDDGDRHGGGSEGSSEDGSADSAEGSTTDAEDTGTGDGGDGSDRPGPDGCTAGRLECVPEVCKDIESDPEHCGACFFACPPGLTCSAGQCS